MKHVHRLLRVWCVLRGHRRKFGTYPFRGMCIRCGYIPPQFFRLP